MDSRTAEIHLMQSAVDQLFVGKLKTLQPEGQSTGIYKDPIDQVSVDINGFTDDIQADRRFHGGPEKAVHQYAANSYAVIRQAYPRLEKTAVVGSMGENISSQALNDNNVHIGDIIRYGAVLLQVSQPRSPCWKINHKFDQPDLSRFVEESHITGWYFRVLETGNIRINDVITLECRPNETCSIAQFNRIIHQHRPALNDLKDLQTLVGLSPEWLKKIHQRIGYLEKIDY